MSGPAVKNNGCRQVLVPARLLHRHRRIHQVLLRIQQQSEVTSRHRETGAIQQNHKTKTKRRATSRQRETVCETSRMVRGEDTETLVPARVSQDSDSERPTKVVSISRKHSIYTYFPKDRNCEVCLRTKMTRAPCRRRTGDAVPRATEFDDLITADHKVLNEEGESRNNHRYTVVVQDPATQWIQFYPCKTKTSQETERSSRKFLEPSKKPKVIYTDNSLEFGKSCEDISWNHRSNFNALSIWDERYC